MSHGPFSSPERFFASVQQLCAQIRAAGAVPILYATWAYQKGSAKLAAKSWDYDEMAHALTEAYRAYRTAAKENQALLAEVGLRFYQLADACNLYAADGIHPSEAGSRLAAETIAAVIQTHKETQS